MLCTSSSLFLGYVIPPPFSSSQTLSPGTSSSSLSSLATFSPLRTSSPSELTLLDPLTINGNADFLTHASLHGWSGNGSQTNPISISNVNITVYSNSSMDLPAINLSNTDLHFHFHNIVLHENFTFVWPFSHPLLFLSNVTNGHFSDVFIDDPLHLYSGGYKSDQPDYRVFLENCQFLTLSNITITGGNLEVFWIYEFVRDNLGIQCVNSSNLLLIANNASISLVNCVNNTLVNNTMAECEIVSGSNNLLINNTLIWMRNNDYYMYRHQEKAFHIISSHSNNFTANTGSFWLTDSTQNLFFDNSIYILKFESSMQNTFSYNRFSLPLSELNHLYYTYIAHDRFDASILSPYFHHFDFKNPRIDIPGNIFLNNSINGKEVFLGLDIHEKVFSSNVGLFYLLNCSDIEISNRLFEEGEGGIALVSCSNVSIVNNSFDSSHSVLPFPSFQISLHSSSNILIVNNSLSHIQLSNSSNIELFSNSILVGGLDLESSHHNSLINNSVLFGKRGIYLVESNHNSLINNSVSDLWAPPAEFLPIHHFFQYSYYRSIGIRLDGSSFNFLMRNYVHNCTGGGIYVSASSNSILMNTISFIQLAGIRFEYGSAHNIITNNNIIHCSLNETADKSSFFAADWGFNNTFSHNYWSNWAWPDRDGDNIVDNPYPILTSETEILITNYDSSPRTSPIPTTFHTLIPPIVLFPNGGEVIKDNVTVSWRAAVDTASHPITYAVYYSADAGLTWTLLADTIFGTTYFWTFSSIPPGTDYLIKIVARCSEGMTVFDTSDLPFTIIPKVSPSSTSSYRSSFVSFNFLLFILLFLTSVSLIHNRVFKENI